MSEYQTTVHTAKSLQEIQTVLKNFPTVVPLGGATTFYNDERHSSFLFPPHVLMFVNIPELTHITKNERYIEFGALCTFEHILSAGRKNIPEIVYDAIYTTANTGIRALATIGGNIGRAEYGACCFAPLMMLDAKVEVRTARDVVWMSVLAYYEFKIQKIAHVITRIRIPKNNWNFSFYRKVDESCSCCSVSPSFIFLALISKYKITRVYITFTVDAVIRNREFENFLVGYQVPLNSRDLKSIIEYAEGLFGSAVIQSELYRHVFLNLLDHCLYNLEITV